MKIALFLLGFIIPALTYSQLETKPYKGGEPQEMKDFVRVKDSLAKTNSEWYITGLDELVELKITAAKYYWLGSKPKETESDEILYCSTNLAKYDLYEGQFLNGGAIILFIRKKPK